jgi:hypothetical protein
MTFGWRCGDSNAVEREGVNKSCTVLICVAKEHGVKCPKLVYQYQALRNCVIEFENLTPTATDMETYRQ